MCITLLKSLEGDYRQSRVDFLIDEEQAVTETHLSKLKGNVDYLDSDSGNCGIHLFTLKVNSLCRNCELVTDYSSVSRTKKCNRTIDVY